MNLHSITQIDETTTESSTFFSCISKEKPVALETVMVSNCAKFN